MRKMSLALIVLTCVCSTASADLGDPTIQAVCRIKLTNGRSIEGFITMGAGGYDGIHPSGFRFEAGTHKATHFLNLDFKKLVRDSVGNYRIVFNDGRVVNGSALRKPSKIVFLEWEQEVVNDRENQQYKEHDALTLVTELPYGIYIDPKYEGLQKGSVVTIPLNRIASFELIDRPAKKWLDHIKEITEIGEEVNGEAEDWMGPGWYHEFLADKEKYTYIKEVFDRNLKKPADR